MNKEVPGKKEDIEEKTPIIVKENNFPIDNKTHSTPNLHSVNSLETTEIEKKVPDDQNIISNQINIIGGQSLKLKRKINNISTVVSQ